LLSNLKDFFLFFCLMIVLSFASSVFAQVFGAGSEPDSIALGEIPQTDVGEIMIGRERVKPIFGVENFFIKKGGSVVLDFQNLGVPAPFRNNVWVRQSVLGIVQKGELDAATGGERISVGDKLGTTQIIVSEKIQKNDGSSSEGRVLKVYSLTVSDEDLITIAQELKALIGPVEGLEVRIVGSTVVVDGKILIPKEMRRVLSVVGRYQAAAKPVVNLAEISPLAQSLLAKKMEEEIAGGPGRPKDITVKVVNGRFFLEGAVDKLADRQAAMYICQAYVTERYTLDSQGKVESPSFANLPECVQMVRIRQPAAPEPDKMLSVRVDFVTLKRSYMKSFDFSWAPGIRANPSLEYSSDLGRLAGSFTATLSSLFPKLDTMAQNGNARILKSATLLMKDGGGSDGGEPKASILEERFTINIPVTNLDANGNPVTTLQAIPVETIVNIRATSIPGYDKINMAIIATQQEIQRDEGAPAPNVLSNKIDTSLVVGNGESAALGGLVAERRSISTTRDPASESGVDFSVFELGRSQSLTDNKDQFIIFVTPTKLRSASQGTDSLKRKFRLRR
jgi:pilus assembly protein CpaC